MRKHTHNGLVRPSLADLADDLLVSIHRQISVENCVEYIYCPKSNKTATVILQNTDSGTGYEVCSDCGAKVRF